MNLTTNEAITVCSVCKKPAHPTETDDLDRHPECQISETTTLGELQKLLRGFQLRISVVLYGYSAEILDGEDGCGSVLGYGLAVDIPAAIEAAYVDWKVR